MTFTRVATFLVFLIGSTGLAVLSLADSIAIAAAGSALVMAAAIYLVRHFWRESAKRNRQELTSQIGESTREVSELRQTSQQLVDSMRGELQGITARVDAFARGVLEYVAQIQLDLEKSRSDSVTGHADVTPNIPDLEIAVERAQDHIMSQVMGLEKAVERARDHIMSQVMGVIGIYATLKPQLPYPPFGGWAVSGDCARRLVELVLVVRPAWIVEVGSGLSTLLMAQALELAGGDGRVVALEHEKLWLDKSTDLLARHEVAHRANIVHAPLAEVDVGGGSFRWYDLSTVNLPDEAELIFIDGPPEGTGPLARYPALPLLIDRLVPGGVILMDDANRSDERAAIDRWQDEISGLEIIFQPDAKGTVQIRRGTG